MACSRTREPLAMWVCVCVREREKVTTCTQNGTSPCLDHQFNDLIRLYLHSPREQSFEHAFFLTKLYTPSQRLWWFDHPTSEQQLSWH